MKVRRSLSLLDPVFRPEAERLIAWVELRGWPLKTFETFRSIERQAELYAQGRTEPGRRVTWVEPGNSAHNHGMAIDLVEYTDQGWTWDTGLDAERMRVEHAGRWEMWRDVAQVLRDDFPGLEWGGRFGYRPPALIGRDPWHFELRGWRKIAGLR